MILNEGKYIDDFKKKHHGYEVFAYGKFKPALDEQIKPVIAHIKHYGSITDSIINMLIEKKPIEHAYKEVYLKIGVLHASWTLNRINALGKKESHVVIFQKRVPSLLENGWQRLMNLFFLHESADRVSHVTETTREKVRNALADSIDLPISERADYMVETLSNRDFNRYRALMIARTESTAAANKGASIGNDSANYKTNKRWLAVMDRNTRPTHIEANGQTVPTDEMFIVGKSECMYPGDLSLPAEECINCRCTVVYIPVFDDDGLPLLKY